MWTDVGHVPVVGPYSSVIISAVPIIAVLGTIVIILLVGRSRIPEGEIRISILGIKVRWGPSAQQKNKQETSKNSTSSDEEDGT
jgi:hypothetical protein